MMRGKFRPLTDPSTGPAERTSALQKRFQFSRELSQTLERELGRTVANQLASRSLHIKGMGFDRNQIAELALMLRAEAGSVSAWEDVSSLLRAAEGNTEIAVAARRAGLSADQLKAMDASARTVERLNLMSEVRSL